MENTEQSAPAEKPLRPWVPPSFERLEMNQAQTGPASPFVFDGQFYHS